MTKHAFINTYGLSGTSVSIEVEASDHGLTHARLLPAVMIPSLDLENRHLAAAAAALCRYFGGVATELPGELCPAGTPFQKSVWNATRRIPYGHVRSYSWVAREVGNPRGVRAVAQALGANPLLLFVPCHRVVRSNGDIGGFGCGVEIKLRLLALEGIDHPDMLSQAGCRLS